MAADRQVAPVLNGGAGRGVHEIVMNFDPPRQPFPSPTE